MAMDTTPFDHVRDPRLLALLRHWLHLAETRMPPPREWLDPVQFSSALSVAWLCEWEQPCDGFRYRLAGEMINHIFGRNLRGRMLEDVVARDHLAETRAVMRDVINAPAAIHVCGPLYRCLGALHVGERLMLPLAATATRPAAIVGATTVRAPDPDAPPIDGDTVMTRVGLRDGLRSVRAWSTAIPRVTPAQLPPEFGLAAGAR